MEKVLNIFQKILENENLTTDFLNLKNLEEINDFCKKLDSSLTEEEFESGIKILMSEYEEISKLDESTLEKVAGGKNMSTRFSAIAMAAMMLTSTAGTTFHASEAVSENQSVVKSTNNNKGVLKTAKDKIKSLGRWVKNHPVDTALGLSATALAIYFLIEKHIQDSKTAKDFTNCGEELLKEHQKILTELNQDPDSDNNISLIKAFMKAVKKFSVYCEKFALKKECYDAEEATQNLIQSANYFENKKQYDQRTDKVPFEEIGNNLKTVIQKLESIDETKSESKFENGPEVLKKLYRFKTSCINFNYTIGLKFQKYRKLNSLIKAFMDLSQDYEHNATFDLNEDNYKLMQSTLLHFSSLLKDEADDITLQGQTIKGFLQNISEWENKKYSEQNAAKLKEFLFNPNELRNSLGMVAFAYEELLKNDPVAQETVKFRNKIGQNLKTNGISLTDRFFSQVNFEWRKCNLTTVSDAQYEEIKNYLNAFLGTTIFTEFMDQKLNNYGLSEQEKQEIKLLAYRIYAKMRGMTKPVSAMNRIPTKTIVSSGERLTYREYDQTAKKPEYMDLLSKIGTSIHAALVTNCPNQLRVTFGQCATELDTAEIESKGASSLDTAVSYLRSAAIISICTEDPKNPHFSHFAHVEGFHGAGDWGTQAEHILNFKASFSDAMATPVDTVPHRDREDSMLHAFTSYGSNFNEDAFAEIFASKLTPKAIIERLKTYVKDKNMNNEAVIDEYCKDVKMNFNSFCFFRSVNEMDSNDPRKGIGRIKTSQELKAMIKRVNPDDTVERKAKDELLEWINDKTKTFSLKEIREHLANLDYAKDGTGNAFSDTEGAGEFPFTVELTNQNTVMPFLLFQKLINEGYINIVGDLNDKPLEFKHTRKVYAY